MFPSGYTWFIPEESGFGEWGGGGQEELLNKFKGLHAEVFLLEGKDAAGVPLRLQQKNIVCETKQV